MQHPDITAAQRTGWAGFQSHGNRDTPESRWEFVEEHQVEFLRWLREGCPQLAEEFIRFGFHYHRCDYEQWLN